MTGLFIYGKIKELPYTIESSNPLKNTVLIVEVARPFRNSHGQYELDTFECVTWRGMSATVLNNCKIGDQVAIKARLESTVVESESGDKQYSYNIVAESVSF
ncbi:MAG: single-stranded DNA-binding protein [Erysipelothrix sp.]|nr:single-stranded DNA-binding protein [Erysipelothrix sp.]